MYIGPSKRSRGPPPCCSYSSGGEDGFIRMHEFDPAYFDFELEYWRHDKWRSSCDAAGIWRWRCGIRSTCWSNGCAWGGSALSPLRLRTGLQKILKCFDEQFLAQMCLSPWNRIFVLSVLLEKCDSKRRVMKVNLSTGMQLKSVEDVASINPTRQWSNPSSLTEFRDSDLSTCPIL